MDSILFDTIHCDILIPATVAAKLKKRAKEQGVSMSHYINVLLFSHTHKDPWTPEDELERSKLITRKNAAKNNKKGSKK